MFFYEFYKFPLAFCLVFLEFTGIDAGRIAVLVRQTERIRGDVTLQIRNDVFLVGFVAGGRYDAVAVETDLSGSLGVPYATDDHINGYRHHCRELDLVHIDVQYIVVNEHDLGADILFGEARRGDG